MSTIRLIRESPFTGILRYKTNHDVYIDFHILI